jgi:hypothetical protein
MERRLCSCGFFLFFFFFEFIHAVVLVMLTMSTMLLQAGRELRARAMRFANELRTNVPLAASDEVENKKRDGADGARGGAERVMGDVQL